MKQVNLKSYDRAGYAPGSFLKRASWYVISLLFVDTKIPWPTGLKIFWLRLFGTRAGTNIVIKPSVRIKYPWFLSLGNHVWLGENVWLDNLCEIKIGDDVCLSQGVYMTSGNHDYKRTTFSLLLQPIVIEEGVWVGAKAIICPKVTLGSHSVITAGSVVTATTDAYKIYHGNPAQPQKDRIIA